MKARTRSASAAAAALLFPLCAGAQTSDKVSDLILEKFKGENDWSKYLADTASAPIGAAGMLGISGDSIKQVENVRDFVVALKGLSTSESKATIALSFTPARTSIVPMNLSTYAGGGIPARLLGSLTFGYAQGDASISEKAFERRAVSVESNFFFEDRDDPVVAYARAIAKGGTCLILKPSPPDDVTIDRTPTGPQKPKTADEKEAEEAREIAKACKESVIKNLRWNRSQASFHYATGRIKQKDGGVETSLGNAFALSITWGLGEKFAAAGSYRRTTKEPVLESLVTTAIQKKDSSLGMIQLSGGSEKMRLFAEASNAKESDVTASSRTFKRALGLDIRVYEAMWLNLRVGRQAKIDGTGTETGSLLSLSYSPSALLK